MCNNNFFLYFCIIIIFLLLLGRLLLRWLLLKKLVIFADFEQVKYLVVILLTLNKSINLVAILLTLNKSENGWLLLRLLLLTFSHCKTPLEETGCLGNPYFTHWLPNHPVFWFTLTQSVRLPVVTYPSLCSPCVTYGTLCHAIGHQVLPTTAFKVIPHSSWAIARFLDPSHFILSAQLVAEWFATLPQPYLGKQRIFLGVAIILSMYLYPDN